MKIAQVAPLYESVPPQLYGGTERVVSYLTEELVRQGHEVTLFASGDSVTTARLEPVCERALRLDSCSVDPLAHHILALERVARRLHDFDIIHYHLDYVHYPLSRRTRASHGDHAAWPAGYSGPGAALPRVHGHARRLHFRCPARTAAARELGRRPCRMACRPTCCRSARRRTITWRFSDGSRPRSGSTAPSRSRDAPGSPCEWPPRSTRRIATTSNGRSRRCSPSRSSSSSARSTKPRRPNFSAARARCSSPSIGASRSAW